MSHLIPNFNQELEIMSKALDVCYRTLILLVRVNRIIRNRTLIELLSKSPSHYLNVYHIL